MHRFAFRFQLRTFDIHVCDETRNWGDSQHSRDQNPGNTERI